MRSFALVELLVVIGILTSLAKLLLPVLQSTICQAKLISDVSNQKQIVIGVLAYPIGVRPARARVGQPLQALPYGYSVPTAVLRDATGYGGPAT
jgi:hypothetical protein